MRLTSPAAATALVRDLLEGVDPAPALTLTHWVTTSPRFAAFVAANRDKIRKKLRDAGDGAGRAGVEAELAVAVLLLRDRRVELNYEPSASGRGGPDFAATFRTRTRFNVEVTRLSWGDPLLRPPQDIRPTLPPDELPSDDSPSAPAQDHAATWKLATTVCAKLRQLPPSAINVLALVTPDPLHGAPDVAGAVQLLKAQAARKEDGFFERRGLGGTRDFHRLYPRLSGALVLGGGATPRDPPSREAPSKGAAGDPLWVNKEARHPLPADVSTSLRAGAREQTRAGPFGLALEDTVGENGRVSTAAGASPEHPTPPEGEAPRGVFTKTAAFYDAVYSFKDYPTEAGRLHALIEARRRPAAPTTLLDVACGTGKHLELLRSWYDVSGLDLDARLLAIAGERLPGVPLHVGDMTAFDLERTYGAVVCLFSSIGYVKTLDRLHRAVAALARHVAPGGVLVVEPWFTPETYLPGRIHALFVDQPQLKLSRMNVSAIDGGVSVLDFHYLVATPDGVAHFGEHHELGLFTREQYEEAFGAAGLAVEHDPEGLTGRGLYLGTRP